MGESRKIILTVNGKRYEEEVEVRVTLADFIRHQLGLTGTHLGCEHGVCGACTILFHDRHGLQCGFCTPGILTTLIEFLRDNPEPTEQEVRIAISGNLCRCTGYQNIVTATLDAAKRLRAQPPQSA